MVFKTIKWLSQFCNHITFSFSLAQPQNMANKTAVTHGARGHLSCTELANSLKQPGEGLITTPCQNTQHLKEQGMHEC